MKLLISETFGPTIQGEGMFTGVPSYFIRTSGCHLRCVWCDSKYTSWEPVGGIIELDSLIQPAVDSKCSHIVITGGEPMLFPTQIATLIAKLRAAIPSVVITIETSGVRYDKSVKPDLWSVSPKLKSAEPNEEQFPKESILHRRGLNNNEVPKFLNGKDVQYKFVVVTERDVEEVLWFVSHYELPTNKIWLMPEGITREEILKKTEWVVEQCKKYQFNLSIRAHALIWGARRGV